MFVAHHPLFRGTLVRSETDSAVYYTTRLQMARVKYYDYYLHDLLYINKDMLCVHLKVFGVSVNKFLNLIQITKPK